MTRQTIVAGAGLLLFVIALFAVRESNRHVAQERPHRLQQLVQEMGLRPLRPPPAQDPALVALGEALFFEEALSGNRDISCATCHHPTLAFGDGLPLSIGPGGTGLGPARQPDPERPLVPRNAISLANVGQAEWDSLFWDGRVQALAGGELRTPAGSHLPAGLDGALAALAMFPVTFRDEMRGGWYDVAGYSLQPGASLDADSHEAKAGGWHDADIYGQPNELAAFGNDADQLPLIWQALMDRLLARPDYRELFGAAYPRLAPETLAFQHAANALAAYETQAFVVVDTSWDRFLAGDDGALSPEEVSGALLFYGDAGCAACHSGDLLSDQAFHNIGAPQFGPGRDEDAPLDYGRWHVTGNAADRFAFRTPALRGVALTGPWLHNGAYDSLEEVVRQHLDPPRALRGYDGASLPPNLRATLQDEPVTIKAMLQTLDPLLAEPRRLSAREVDEIVAFLKALGE